MLDGASLSGGSNAGAAGAEASRLELKQKELDASAFRLMMDEMQYDIESFRVFVRNKAQHETQLARQQVAWDKNGRVRLTCPRMPLGLLSNGMSP